MKYDFLSQYSENTKVWIYQCDRDFNSEEIALIEQFKQGFIQDWAAHGSKLKATVEVLYNRFVIVAADQDVTANSGCSIDASVRFIKQIEAKLGVDLMNRMLVSYKSGDRLQYAHFNDLAKLFEEQVLTPETLVYNNLADTKQAFETQWEIPLKDSWHYRFVNA